jgi:hypothetical protein
MHCKALKIAAGMFFLVGNTISAGVVKKNGFKSDYDNEMSYAKQGINTPRHADPPNILLQKRSGMTATNLTKRADDMGVSELKAKAKEMSAQADKIKRAAKRAVERVLENVGKSDSESDTLDEEESTTKKKKKDSDDEDTPKKKKRKKRRKKKQDEDEDE